MKRVHYLGALLVIVSVLAVLQAQQQTSSPFPTQDASTGATGTAVPAKATFIGERQSTGLAGHIGCDKSAFVNMTTATTTQIVALVSGQTIQVCSFDISGGGTAQTVIFKSGTGTACGTGTASVSGTYGLGINGSIARGNGEGVLFNAGSGNALCATTSAASTTTAINVTFAQF